ncbi:MAG: ABC transporter ATP-binding protein [Acidobacteria bacterium]|nr:ABC transporter ATP-binding protein [Acidobacteriota bacterium]
MRTSCCRSVSDSSAAGASAHLGLSGRLSHGGVVAAAITVENLTKSYGDVHAVCGIDFDVAEGEVFALLGPNGAGKSTTVEILEGHRSRSGGSVTVLGVDPATGGARFRDRIGVVLQETIVEKQLTVLEAIRFHADPYTKRRAAEELIEIVGLQEKTDARVGTLSGGQQRRLELALGLVGDPDLIFLDEPTTGFDPSARRQAWSIIDNLRSLGKTILLTTHYMDEAQHLADRVAVIARGKIIAQGTPDTIGADRRDITVVRFVFNGAAADLPVDAAIGANGAVEVKTSDPVETMHALTTWALSNGVALDGLTMSKPTLEDIYLELVGEVAE